MYRQIKYFFSAFVLFLSLSCAQQKTDVVFLAVEGAAHSDIEAIREFLEKDALFRVRVLQPGETELQAAGQPVVYWLHLPDSISYAQWMAAPSNLDFLKRLYGKAGILLSGYAALLPHKMGIESGRPEVRNIEIKDDWSFDQRGLQSWQGHVVFNDLFGGCFVWDAYENHRLTRIGYFGSRFPQEGRVVAVEKSFITIHPQNKLLIEYSKNGKGLLSLGAFVRFDIANHKRYKLEHLLRNSLRYLAGRLPAKGNTYWQEMSYTPHRFPVSKTRRPANIQKFNPQKSSGLVLQRNPAQNQFYDLAGRRILIMGHENGGVDEVWVHPFRVLRDFRTGLIIGDSVLWLNTLKPRIEIRPESITRYYETPLGSVKEIIFPSLHLPSMTVRYEFSGADSIRLLVRLRSDLRWMWPYDEYALGAVQYGYDADRDVLHIKDASGRFYCLVGSQSRPEMHLTGPFKTIEFDQNKLIGDTTSLNQVFHAVVYKIKRDLQITIAGSDQGLKDTGPAFRRMLAYSSVEYDRLADHYKRLTDRYLSFESPDKEWNALWKWTLVGIDRFFTHTPGLGSALVAGFATTARGWDGRHKISGRPGYAWYFGRDAEWSAFAIADYGDFGKVRRQLEFFQKFQDESGKIFHELSTSGVVHYDAADATPLYVILAAYYLRASGDLDFIRQSWPHIEKAMDYLYSTDTDGDGLIENTNEGHGWVEGGRLWGAHTTLYLAGLWARALQDAAELAGWLHYKDLKKQYLQDYNRAAEKLEKEFWNKRDSFFFYGLWPDGQMNDEKTVLPATMLYFNHLDPDKADKTLRYYGTNGFSTDWGVRILSSASPLFNPRGYHYGSVWPLFTGWAALAEYAYGRPLQGFTHITNNLYIKNHWALGFVEEVMNGARYQPSGVCPHQCWSETNIAHPAISGMLGWRPDALHNSAVLQPAVPPQWDSLAVKNLRVGQSRLGFRMIRKENETQFRFKLIQGPPVKIQLKPWFPLTTRLVTVRSDKDFQREGQLDEEGGLKQPLAFNLADEQNIVFGHRGGISMLPVLPRPSPGQSSNGYRIVEQKQIGRRLLVNLEGKRGTTAVFRLKAAKGLIESIDGVESITPERGNIFAIRVSFPEEKQEFCSKQIVIHISDTFYKKNK